MCRMAERAADCDHPEPESAPELDQLTQIAGGPLTHQVPHVPVLLDGVMLDDPEKVTTYNGTPLYYTPIGSFPTVALAAFTKREAMLGAEGDARLSLEVGFADAVIEVPIFGPITIPTVDEVRFFEHTYRRGAQLTLAPNRAYRDLTGLSFGGGPFGIGSSSWNDAISSTSACRFAVSLFEHTNYGGSELRVPAGANAADLVPLGWNDRASSVVNWGF
jgi:hypothetical protein